MIKIFTLNKNEKIELTKEELQHLLDEAYKKGQNHGNAYAYTPYYFFPYNDTSIRTVPFDDNKVYC